MSVRRLLACAALAAAAGAVVSAAGRRPCPACVVVPCPAACPLPPAPDPMPTTDAASARRF